MASHAPMQPIIYGRERERARLQQLLEDAIGGHGALVLISGEAGIGKTALVNDLLLDAEKRGCLLLTGGCYDLTTTPPYGPWIEAIRDYQPSESQPSIPSWISDPDELEKVGSQAALFEEMRQFFAEIAERQPLVIVLEDLHWSDTASLELLRFLARRISDEPVLLAATYRDDEITRRHPLFQTIPLLVREANTRRIDLQRLDPNALESLISGYGLPQPDSARLVTYLHERAEGNPLFTTELLRSLEIEGIVQANSTGATLGNLDGVTLPPFILQVIEQRLAHLESRTREALEVAAVIGHEVPLDVWEMVSKLDQDVLEPIVAEALENHVIEETSNVQRFRFVHALVREVLYESIVPTRRRVRHREVGEALEILTRPDPDSIAYHFQRAGDARAVDWLVRAAARAERLYAFRVAAERYEAAVELLEGSEERAYERGDLLIRLSEALRWIDPGKGVVYAEEARHIAEEIGDRELGALSRHFRALLLCFSGSVRQGLPEMDAARREFDDLAPDEWSRQSGDVNPIIGTVLLWTALVGQFRKCLELGEQLLPDFEGFEDRLAVPGHPHVAGFDTSAEIAGRGVGSQVACLCSAMAMSYAMTGHPELADPLSKRAVAIFRAINHHVQVANSALNNLSHITIPYHTDELNRREYWAEQAVSALAQASGSMRDQVVPRMNRMPLLVVEGKWDEVEELAPLHRQATANVATHVIGRAALATVSRHQDNYQLAWQQIHEALPLGPDNEPGEHQFLHAAVLQRLAADLSLDASDLEQARAWIESHQRWLEWSGAVLGRAEAQLLWARYHQIAGDLRTALRHAECALAYATDPRQPLALIAADRSLGQLKTALGEYDTAREHLQASLELAGRCDAPYEVALTKLDLAELAIRVGDTTEARRLLREIRVACEELRARRSLERVTKLEHHVSRSANGHPAGLSDREVEVLEQAATGMTNAEIGEALYISPRTVAQHLRSVYNKLSVNNRAAAVARWAELKS